MMMMMISYVVIHSAWWIEDAVKSWPNFSSMLQI
jgi:hypothetical protein